MISLPWAALLGLLLIVWALSHPDSRPDFRPEDPR